MIRLEKKDYFKVVELLNQVMINNLFARSIIEGLVAGVVYVDNTDSPKTCYILHPYGMSLLFGDSGNIEFNDQFKDYALNTKKIRNRHEWMQAFPNSWDNILKDLFNGCAVKSSDDRGKTEAGIIELNTRVNFKFNLKKYLLSKQSTRPNIEIVRTNREIAALMKGSVVPLNFWNNVEDFHENGIGFSLFDDNQLASMAFSAFILDNKLELGVETLEEYKGKGLGQHVCSTLIDYCLKRAINRYGLADLKIRDHIN